MKKKIIVSIIFAFILIAGVISSILWTNRTVATITLDINPSIEINLTKKEKVKSIVPLNDDAKDIISSDLKGKSLNNALKSITNNLIDKGYIDEDRVEIILYSKGSIKSEEVESSIKNYFSEKQISADVIIIKSVTKDDEKLAKKYNISPAKVTYIKSITENNENISIEDLTNKSVSELNETKATGKYCHDGFTLEGDWCLREINQISASDGEVCPRGYLEYDGKCYEETESIEGNNYVCRDDFKLENNKCVREMTENAIPIKYSCSSGVAKTRVEAGLSGTNDGDANDIVCVDESNATHPMSPCEVNDGTEYTMAGGKCYWHKAPVIASGCPGKVQVNGFCWDDASSVLICVGARDGKQYSSRSEFCEGSVKYINPVVSEYKCENKNAKLTGTKCVVEELEDAEKQRYCPSGYTLVDHDRCINYNKTTNKESGLVCEGENSRLKGSTCIIYEMIEAS